MGSSVKCGFVLSARLPGVGKWRTTFGLHGMQCGASAAGVKALSETRGECSPTNLHEESRDERWLHVLGDVRHLPPDGATAVKTPCVLGALHTEWDRAVAHRFAKAMHAGVARWVVVAPRTVHHVGTEPTQARDECGVGVLGYEHLNRPGHCASQGAGGESGIAAAGDSQRWTILRRGALGRRSARERGGGTRPGCETQSLGSHEVQQLSKEEPRFLRTCDVVCFVFHPHPTVL